MAIRMRYVGTHLSQFSGKEVQISKLARFLGLPRETLGATVRRSARIQKTRTIDDDDLARYLFPIDRAIGPDMRYQKHRELMARSWA